MPHTRSWPHITCMKARATATAATYTRLASSHSSPAWRQPRCWMIRLVSWCWATHTKLQSTLRSTDCGCCQSVQSKLHSTDSQHSQSYVQHAVQRSTDCGYSKRNVQHTVGPVSQNSQLYDQPTVCAISRYCQCYVQQTLGAVSRYSQLHIQQTVWYYTQRHYTTVVGSLYSERVQSTAWWLVSS